LLLGLTGCGEFLETHYGDRTGFSVNGTQVLQKLFRDSGYRVYSRRRLTSKLNDSVDCLCWLPDSMGVPLPSEERWLEQWLRDKPGRVLIYVGREYDAATEYWKQVAPGTPKDIDQEVKDRLEDALAEWTSLTGDAGRLKSAPWMSFRENDRKVGEPLPGKKLAGDPQWIAGIDGSLLKIPVKRGLDPPFEADIRVQLDDEPLVSVQPWETATGGASHLIYVVNGAFLVNYGLVNPERRKLARRLVAEVGRLCPEEPRQVVFLESGLSGLPIGEEVQGQPMVWDFFAEPPLSYIFTHLALLAVAFVFCRWPIFGRPKEEPPPLSSDFGRHVEALGELLQLTGDQQFARSRWLAYWQHVKQDTPGGKPSGGQSSGGQSPVAKPG